MDTFYVTFVILLIVSSVAVRKSQGQKQEYDVCKLGAMNKQNHICMKISNCPSVLAALRKGIIPKICGYKKKMPIVCCPQNTTVTPARSAVSIVDEMCTKYKQSQYKLEKRDGDLLGDPPYIVKVAMCEAPLETLILGGEQAKPREFPHMALIGYGDTEADRDWKCGGSLISERYILTAAHCIVKYSFGEPKWVRLGEFDYMNKSDDARPEDFNIVEMISHPNYSYPTYYNDIALLKLDRDVKFNPYIRPVCLDTATKITEEKATATGWGQLGLGLPTSDRLMKVSLSFTDYDKCKKIYGVNAKYNAGINAQSQICAGDLTGKKDTCQGDSGGPLQVRKENEPCMYIQLGITSFGPLCGEPNHPGVYTRVYNFIDWIQSIVWPQ